MMSDVPTYTYRCLACQHEEDRFLTISKAVAKTDCPACGALATFDKVIVGYLGGSRDVVPSGVVIPGCRVQYPYYNPQLPVMPGQKPGEQIVTSRQHLRELCARHDYRANQ